MDLEVCVKLTGNSDFISESLDLNECVEID